MNAYQTFSCAETATPVTLAELEEADERILQCRMDYSAARETGMTHRIQRVRVEDNPYHGGAQMVGWLAGWEEMDRYLCAQQQLARAEAAEAVCQVLKEHNFEHWCMVPDDLREAFDLWNRHCKVIEQYPAGVEG